MRIVIDLQGAQAENRKRGIGRYSLSLAKAIVAQRGEAEVLIVLSDAFPDTIEPLRAEFAGLLLPEQIKVWSCPPQTRQLGSANSWDREAAELLREAFIANLNPSVVLVCSLFEGLVDEAVTSIGRLSQRVPTAMVLYDLIPIIYRDLYLKEWAVDRWYENKLGHLRRADLLLAISHSSGNEAQTYLGLPAERIVTISTSADSHFQERVIPEQERAELQARIGLTGDFVLYTGGIDHRKNIEGLIRGYSLLSPKLRQSLQLAIVCSVQPAERERLEALVRSQGLKPHEVVFTGFVSEDDLLRLYNSCKVFVFPSWHEGFGLPALEAMSCGRAVIASNSSSLPEVIGNEAALFDPRSDEALADKLGQVLTDEVFRAQLQTHARQQSRRFSWQHCAEQTLTALHALVAQGKPSRTKTRPRLAYVSPLPPLRSGISDYSAELLPELCRYYEVEVIAAQDEVTSACIAGNCAVRDVSWFRCNADRYDRVLYHFGNSVFHEHMFALLEEIPGTVVLHDFFLSGILAHLECQGLQQGVWVNALYESHGYAAVIERLQAEDTADIVWKYPCNYPVIANAEGVIVHSQSSQRMADAWYGSTVAQDWACIPLLRVPDLQLKQDRALIRKKLGLKSSDFVVCSFGLLGPSKMNDRLLSAWLQSPLAQDDNNVLIFVGENDQGIYGEKIQREIAASGRKRHIRITGWTDAEAFGDYLAIADVGVQLRTRSRGETSAAVLDCMKYGLPTIVNANGSMADLPAGSVLMLDDQFADVDLVRALEQLHRDAGLRHELGKRARSTILTQHAPRLCAEQYHKAIEAFYDKASIGAPALVRRIMAAGAEQVEGASYRQLARALDLSLPPPCHQRQILVDVSELVQRDARSGIQRVVRSVLREWLEKPVEGYRIEPVYAVAGTAGYRYARRFALEFLGGQPVLQDEPVTFRAGDIFFALDLQPAVVAEQADQLRQMKLMGVRTYFLIYDLIPVLHPQYFPEGAQPLFDRWFSTVIQADGAVCISQATADAVRMLVQQRRPNAAFALRVSHIGADIEASLPTIGLPDEANAVLNRLTDSPSFLMVGTIEPRKGHRHVLDAFEQLWQQGEKVNLVIVGKQGWLVEDVVARLTDHPQANQRLFWLQGISDEYLERLYGVSVCLIAASYEEGFGLPLIEAAQKGLPVLARDIPVFREVAKDSAYYFAVADGPGLAADIQAWLALYRAGTHPDSRTMPWLTWAESARTTQELIIDMSTESRAT